MKSLLFIPLVLVLSGCATTVIPGDMASRAPTSEQNATVYIFEASMSLVSENVPLFVDQENIGALALRSYTWIHLPPGKHTIAIGDSFPAHRMVAKSIVTLKAGEVRYLKYVLNPGADPLALGHLSDLVSGKQVSTPDGLFPLEESEAEKLLARYKLVGNLMHKKEANQPVETTPVSAPH